LIAAQDRLHSAIQALYPAEVLDYNTRWVSSATSFGCHDEQRRSEQRVS
jgi:hypothetical protein